MRSRLAMEPLRPGAGAVLVSGRSDDGVLRAASAGRASARRPCPAGAGPHARRDQLIAELEAVAQAPARRECLLLGSRMAAGASGQDRYPEHELRKAGDGYLALRDAAESPAARGS